MSRTESAYLHVVALDVVEQRGSILEDETGVANGTSTRETNIDAKTRIHLLDQDDVTDGVHRDTSHIRVVQTVDVLLRLVHAEVADRVFFGVDALLHQVVEDSLPVEELATTVLQEINELDGNCSVIDHGLDFGADVVPMSPLAGNNGRGYHHTALTLRVPSTHLPSSYS